MVLALTLFLVFESVYSESVSFTVSTPKTKLVNLNFEAPYYGTGCSLTNYTDSTGNDYNWMSLMAIDEIEINIYDNKFSQYNNSNNQIGTQLPLLIKTSTSVGLPAISQCTSKVNNNDIILCYALNTKPLPTIACNIFDNKASELSDNITITGNNAGLFSPVVICTNNGYIVIYEYVFNYSLISTQLKTQIYYTVIDFDGKISGDAQPLLMNTKSNISSIPYNPQQYLFIADITSNNNADTATSFFLVQTTEFMTYGIVGNFKGSTNTVDITNTFSIIDKTVGFSVYNNPLSLKVSDDCCFVFGYGADVLSPIYFDVYDYSGKIIGNMMNIKVGDRAYGYSFVALDMLNNGGDTYFGVLYLTKDNSTNMNLINNNIFKISYTSNKYSLNNITSTPNAIITEPANYTSFTITPCVNMINNELVIVTTTASYNQYTPQPIFGQTFNIAMSD